MTLPSQPVSILHVSRTDGVAPGGVDCSVGQLVEALQQRGQAAQWYTSSGHWPGLGDCRLADQVRSLRPDLVHVHGLWQFPTRLARLLESEFPVVIAPHGMLDPWALARRRWKKAPAWHLWERGTLARARCLHALSPSEARAIRALGFRGPIAILPNGTPSLDQSRPRPLPPWSGRVPNGERVLLFLGRLHRKKGVAPLLEAWSRLSQEARRQGWWLVLVGPGESLHRHLRQGSAGLDRCLVFGPRFDAEKEACLAAASAFVLPSLSEGLPIAALEAMSWQLPVLLSPACNLPEAYAVVAALRVEPTADDLERMIHQLMHLPEAELTAMGARGMALVEAQFSWPRVAAMTAQLYDWLLGAAECPEFVEQEAAGSC
ncbi:glycosyltransferase [Synechococcus sp. 1G10]|uniref:glycosyltransferase n=1 Tax=Synechococcus sp. 1G10 TaxID=2025605 RepID=UPI001303C9BD|nr:glycosyltransferase [Synechococcus sp. 1G10]